MGAMSRNKGAAAERHLVAYLRTAGFGGAERAVRTGYRVATRYAADPGDVTGTPGIIWSVKDCVEERLDRWLDELDAMDGRPEDVRLLVHKRAGKTDPARWWCWMWLNTLLGFTSRSTSSSTVPVRMELGHVVPLLRAAGYGDEMEAVG